MSLRNDISGTLPLFAFFFLFSSCSNKSENDLTVLKALDESLTSSNITINLSSVQIIKSLETKLTDPVTHEQASILLPKIKQVRDLSTEIFNYVEGLKRTNILTSENSTQLYTKLLKYKEDILNIDSSLRYQFADNIILTTNAFDTTANTQKDFYTIFFRKTSATASWSMLSKIQNNIKIIENKILIYLFQKMTSHQPYYDLFSAIVGQSSSILKAGEIIEIQAGLGAFSTKEEPEIIINGKKVELNEMGYSLFKMKVAKNPGKYSIPVSISFNGYEGKRETKEMSVKYTVVKECNQ